jgi:alcohol dehydrogenase class IV
MVWYFYSSNIIYGENAINFLNNLKGNKCFIVTDKNIEEIGHLKILTNKLEEYGKEWKVFNNVVPDPHEDDVLTAKESCISYSPEIIIALGGGSVIDTAKVVWVLYEFPEFNMDTDIHPFKKELFELGKKAKFIAIPTTSGTGSEASFGIVISRQMESGVWRKLELAHAGVMPTWAIVDPIFPKDMPPKLTAMTGFDALTHCYENVISQWRSEFSEALTLKGIELIFKYLPIAYKDGENMEARDYMHQAATMAGLAFTNSMAQLGHTLGHSWGGIFHNPHGQLVGIFIPYVLQYCFNNSDENDQSIKILGNIAKKLGWAKWDDDIKKAAYINIDKIRELQREVGIPNKLQDLGISKEDFENKLEALVSLSYQSPVFTACPRSVNPEDLPKLFTYAYEGKDIDF